MDIADMQRDAHAIARSKGWWDEDRPVPECLMLIVSEVAEALECYRDGEPMSWYADGGKPEGMASELADVIIRVGDLAERLGIDLTMAVGEKSAYNATRPYRHGGKLA